VALVFLDKKLVIFQIDEIASVKSFPISLIERAKALIDEAIDSNARSLIAQQKRYRCR